MRLVPSIRHGKPAFTLTEVIVVMAILGILSTGLYAVVTLALTYYRNSMDRIGAETNSRIALSIVTTEFRQASHWGLETTAVVIPTVSNSFTSPAHELDFQELVPNVNLATLAAGALDHDPSQYQLVRYSLRPTVLPTALIRTVAGYDSGGNVLAAGPPSVIVQSIAGGIDISTVFWTSNSVTIVVTAQEGGYVDAQNQYHPAVQDTISCTEVSAAYH